LLKYFDGDHEAIGDVTRDKLKSVGLLTQIEDRCGSYTHHYPICIRRVLPDDTLLSMTSGAAESYYALSFISYARPAERQGFLAFAEVLCRALGALIGARPHWGKVCPLTAAEAARLYPQLPQFREVCRQIDPRSAFRNAWLDRTLFSDTPAAVPPE
jgi:hypothetical protein